MHPSERLAKPITLFCSYSHKDEAWRDRLEPHLSLLRAQGDIRDWHDRRIEAGAEWAGRIDQHIDTADIILLLVSADFLASDYCYDIEMKRALERHNAGMARVIPVILRPVDWFAAPFGKLQALPRDGKPITSWKNRDEALQDVTRGIREAALRLEASISGGSNISNISPVEVHDATHEISSVDRFSIIKNLSRLSPQDFEFLTSQISGALMHISRRGTVPEQTAELIRWAESSTGCGLTAIKQILEESFR